MQPTCAWVGAAHGTSMRWATVQPPTCSDTESTETRREGQTRSCRLPGAPRISLGRGRGMASAAQLRPALGEPRGRGRGAAHSARGIRV